MTNAKEELLWLCDMCRSDDVPFEIDVKRKLVFGGGRFVARLCTKCFAIFAETWGLNKGSS